jgi:hypothetical protein
MKPSPRCAMQDALTRDLFHEPEPGKKVSMKEKGKKGEEESVGGWYLYLWGDSALT